MNAARPATRPPTASPCPQKYFVALCTTVSMPRSRGRWLTGEANVLSQMVVMPARRAIAADRLEVAQRQQRIAGRFQVDQFRRRPDRALHVGRVGRVDEGRLDAERPELRHHQVVRARVDGAGRHDVIAGLHDREDRRRDRRHAARRRHGGLGVLEGRRLALEGRDRRVAPARVDERLLLAGEDRRAVLRRAQVIRRGQVQRRHQRPRRRVGRLAGVDGGGVDAQTCGRGRPWNRPPVLGSSFKAYESSTVAGMLRRHGPDRGRRDVRRLPGARLVRRAQGQGRIRRRLHRRRAARCRSGSPRSR